ncbi:NUDIX domain-containing protein [Novosphingobium sp. M1R2S20]|uniref:NUDIX domain-containing protein n=1 Tax=Novosphingobium rhizovicinum TaxID=3228928 RepID=A0ABV3R8N8_9SPHN
MLHLIPAPLHRCLYRLAHLARSLWWRTLRPTVHGCRVIALDADDRVLLIRQTYGSPHWVAPGGSVARREDPVATAHRELAEETACTLTEALKVAEVVERPSGAYNVVHVVVGRAAGALRPDLREVQEARWFALDLLPEDLSPRVERGLNGWIAAWRAAQSSSN